MVYGGSLVVTDSLLLTLGNQLFPIEQIKQLKIKQVFMAEDYGLCSHYSYHKHKIILFLTSMRRYRRQLEAQGLKVSYYDCENLLFAEPFETKLKDCLSKNPQLKRIITYEIEDKFFEKRIMNFCKSQRIGLVFKESPLFLVTRDEFKIYLQKRKKPFMKTFYELQRKKFHLLVDKEGKPEGGQWSYDKENRKKLPKKINFYPVPKIHKDEILKKVATFVSQKFADNPGNAENFWLPTSRQESLDWLDHFIEYNLPQFGDYQDAITSRSDFLFHSVLSPMLNMGLILPAEIIDRVERTYQKNKQTYKLNSIEGFVRQVLGWREFVRGIYQEYGQKQWETNFWQHQRVFKKCWYNASTGLEILDDAIEKAQKYSYGHHIERLMIISNMMLLCEIHPHKVYQWFMEMYSDSSDWVMGPNVFGMGQYSDGGIFATKPYTCGSNYYLKMGDYQKGNWCEIVDGLYWRFISNNIEFYKTNPRMAVMVKNLEKMDKERKVRIFSKAEQFIEKVTLKPTN